MGGVKSWKTTEKEKRNGGGWGWEDEKQVGLEGEGVRGMGQNRETRGEREEREEREGGDGYAGGRMEENDDDEVSSLDSQPVSMKGLHKVYATNVKSTPGLLDGHDATKSQHRSQYYRLQQESSKLG